MAIIILYGFITPSEGSLLIFYILGLLAGMAVGVMLETDLSAELPNLYALRPHVSNVLVACRLPYMMGGRVCTVRVSYAVELCRGSTFSVFAAALCLRQLSLPERNETDPLLS